MKKLLGGFLLVLATFALFACDQVTSSTTLPTTTITTEAPTSLLPTTLAPTTQMSTLAPTTLLTTEATTLPTTVPTTTTVTTTTADWTYTTDSVAFVNYSTEFVKEEPVEDITLYFYSGKPGIPYVDINEFVTMLLGIIDDSIQVDVNGNIVRVWTEYFYTEEEKLEYGIEEDSYVAYVEFDFDTMTVEAPDINAFDMFSGDTETDFSEGLDLVSYTEEELPLFFVNLSEYDFEFRQTEVGLETKYTIPLSLAGLFLTGSMFDVVHNGAVLYGLDTYQLGDVNDPESELSAITALNQDATPELELESRRFLEFAFDHFYGLKDYKSIESFQTYTDSYFRPEEEFEYSFTRFIDSFEDLHTGVISYGHNNPGYYHGSYPQYIYDYTYESYGCECNYEPSNFKLSFYKNMALLRITEFTVDFKAQLEPKMQAIIDHDYGDYQLENIVIDLACNGGGVLAGVLHLLNYLTNEDISIYTNTLGADSSETYDVAGDLAIDANFFIVTSGATYSAANLFTALAKDTGLAQTIGSKSGGGACAVKALVLPNGAIMQMSSNMNLTYADFETVEEGVAPDYVMNFYGAGKAAFQYADDPDYPSLIDFYTIVKSMTPAE